MRKSTKKQPTNIKKEIWADFCLTAKRSGRSGCGWAGRGSRGPVKQLLDGFTQRLPLFLIIIRITRPAGRYGCEWGSGGAFWPIRQPLNGLVAQQQLSKVFKGRLPTLEPAPAGVGEVVDKEDVVRAVVGGYTTFLNHVSETPWADAAFSVEYLEGVEDLNDSELIDILARWAGYDYEDFKGIWDSLSDKEKNEALGEIGYEIAVLGFEWLLKGIATDFYVMENGEVREKIVKAAKRYINGEIDFYDLAEELENILWPTEKEKEENDQAVKYYWDGISLTDYIEKEKVKELVKRYLIEELEAIGKTSDLEDNGG